jgi:hypothetical protein
MVKKLFVFLAVAGLIFTFTGVCFADLNDGLVAYYPFNGNADDESGNGNHGTVYGATITEDRFGNTESAYSFNSVGNYDFIGVSNSSSLSNLEEISVAFWTKQFECNLF